MFAGVSCRPGLAAAGRVAALLCALHAAAAPLRAQDPDTACDSASFVAAGWVDPVGPLLRLAHVGGAAPAEAADFRRPSDHPVRSTCALGPLRARQAPERDGGLRVHVAPLRTRALYTSAYGEKRLDGRLAPARGASVLLQAGAIVGLGPLTAGLLPEAAAQENRDMVTPTGAWAGRSEPYPFTTGIDLPQRFGDEPLRELDLGQSFVRLDLLGIKAGWSRESLLYGPARHNPLLLGPGGESFPHWFLGTSGELDTPLGGFALETFWGRVRESDHFDDDESNDEQLLSGAIASWRPPALDGLRVGAIRIFMASVPPEGIGFLDELMEPWAGFLPNDAATAAENQAAGLFFRWHPARGGLEVYGEWARDDFWDGQRDLLVELDHAQAWTVGFLWLDRAPRARLGRFGLGAEHTHLTFSESHRSGRGAVTFYTHSVIRQGMTHEGQLLGAPIGPGSQGTTLDVWHIQGPGVTSLELRHVAHDVDAAATESLGLEPDDRDIELSAGLRHDRALGPLWIGGGVRFTHRANRLYLESLTGTEPAASNWTLTLDVAWLPRGLSFDVPALSR